MFPNPAPDPNASIFLAASVNSDFECANGNSDVFSRSRVAVRFGTGKRGRESCWGAKLGIGGAADFQSIGRGPVRDGIRIFLSNDGLLLRTMKGGILESIRLDE